MQGHCDEVSNRYVAFWTQLFSFSGKTLEEKTSLLELQFRPGQKGCAATMKEIRTRGLFLLAEETVWILLFMQENCILQLGRKNKAKSEGIPPSSLAKRILSENLSEIVRTVILIRSIQEEILVIESMLSCM